MAPNHVSLVASGKEVQLGDCSDRLHLTFCGPVRTSPTSRPPLPRTLSHLPDLFGGKTRKEEGKDWAP